MKTLVVLPAGMSWGEHGKMDIDERAELSLGYARVLGVYEHKELWEIVCTDDTLSWLRLKYGVEVAPESIQQCL